MNWGTLFTSKTFWTGIATVAGGVVMLVHGDQSNGFIAIAGGLGMIFVRDAVAGLPKN